LRSAAVAASSALAAIFAIALVTLL